MDVFPSLKPFFDSFSSDAHLPTVFLALHRYVSLSPPPLSVCSQLTLSVLGSLQ
jgi:hypothetical protein